MILPTVCDIYWAAGYAEGAINEALFLADLPEWVRESLQEAVTLLEHGKAVR